jgi:hypothetical protein
MASPAVRSMPNLPNLPDLAQLRQALADALGNAIGVLLDQHARMLQVSSALPQLALVGACEQGFE